MTTFAVGVTVQERGFGDLESAVMDRVWATGGPVLVRTVFDDLVASRDIAYTTVMSTMDNLHRKGWLARKRIGKAYSYWPTMTREERSAHLMAHALHSGGDADQVLNFFLRQMNDEESERLRVAVRKAPRHRGVMNFALCILLYGFVLAWLLPPVLEKVTRSGRNPRLSVAVWLTAVGCALAAWMAASVNVMAELLIKHAALPAQLCVDMFLALNHFGWRGHVVFVASALLVLGVSILIAKRVFLTLRRFSERSSEISREARILGSVTEHPGVFLIQADQPAAYCVAGPPHAVVVSTGAVARLKETELAAVLAHESAHLSSRHPQIKMTLRALASSVPRVPLFRAAAATVEFLVEMCADDRAARSHGRDALLDSLLVFTAPYRLSPGGALGVADQGFTLRASRLSTSGGGVGETLNRVVLLALMALIISAPAVVIALCQT